MFLETLDIRSKDIVVYSQNKFDLENNFKLINKRDTIKRPQKIDFFEVCNLVKNPIPKHLVVYRLLTNVSQINAYSTKFGFFVNINGKMDIIYFDPIFALEDLKHLQFNLDENRFRFKIQQLGLRSISSQNSEADYTIEYKIDLRASEAKNQDDKIFADAIFVFDDSYSDDFNVEVLKIEKKENDKKHPKSSFDSDIVEDNHVKETKLNELELDVSKNTEQVREEKLKMLKKALGISSVDNKELVVENNKFIERKIEATEMIDLFKSSKTQAKLISEREKDSFLLKLSKE